MARRRLTPAGPARDRSLSSGSGWDGGLADAGQKDAGLGGGGANVARAEHSMRNAAPIARIAADAAGSAAIQEMSDALARARAEVRRAGADGRMVLDLALDQIAPDHLMRDRLAVEDAEMAGLRASLRAHGQRTPVEVTPINGPLPYGLISGWRRLTALKTLHAETGDPRFATIRALVSRPESAAAAYVSMVEENEIRAGLSHYERARVAARAVERGVFETEKAALLALFANVSRAKRSRIRSFLEIYHALDGHLRFPAALPERLGLGLVTRLRAGEGARIAEALARHASETPEAEQALLAAAVAGTRRRRAPETTALPAPDPAVPMQIRPGVACAAHLDAGTLTLRLTGPGVGPALASEVAALLRRLPADPPSGGG